MNAPLSALKEGDSWNFMHNAEPICPHCAASYSITGNEAWELYSDDGEHTVECPCCDLPFAVVSHASWSFSTDEQDDIEESA